MFNIYLKVSYNIYLTIRYIFVFSIKIVIPHTHVRDNQKNCNWTVQSLIKDFGHSGPLSVGIWVASGYMYMRRIVYTIV